MINFELTEQELETLSKTPEGVRALSVINELNKSKNCLNEAIELLRFCESQICEAPLLASVESFLDQFEDEFEVEIEE